MRRPLTADQINHLPDPWRAPLRDFTTALEEAGRAPATIGEYQYAATLLAFAMPDANPWEVSPTVLREWADAQTWGRETRRKHVNGLRQFYGHGITAGHLRRSPMVGVSQRASGDRRPGPQRQIVPPAWREPLADYAAYLLAAGHSTTTRDTRRIHLAALALDFADPWAVTTPDLVLWIGRNHTGPEYRRSLRASARGFYAWALAVGHVPASPAEQLPAIRLPRTLARPATDDALAHALRVASPRVRIAVLLGALAGLRRAEIAAVSRDDLTDDGCLIVTGKGGHQRRVPLVADLSSALGRAFADPSTEDTRWLFPNAHRPVDHITAAQLGRLINAALPVGTTPHQLRHRFATQTYAATRDLLAVQTLLGHSKPETTARYAGVPGEALRAALAGVSLPS